MSDDHLVIPKLTAEDIPAEATEPKEELSSMLPIASLLIELDGRTGFLDCFTHAGGRKLVREETLREANTCIVNHHYGLELATVFDGGTMSSSDGQRFPVRSKS